MKKVDQTLVGERINGKIVAARETPESVMKEFLSKTGDYYKLISLGKDGNERILDRVWSQSYKKDDGKWFMSIVNESDKNPFRLSESQYAVLESLKRKVSISKRLHLIKLMKEAKI